MCKSNLVSGLVECIRSLSLVCGVVFGSSDVDPDDVGIHYIYMEWCIASEQFMGGAATHALHSSRADKAFAIVALWS